MTEPIKTILVADDRSDLLATLEPILKHWGYRVLSTRKASQVRTFLQESSPCMLIIGEALICDPGLELDAHLLARLESGDVPVMALNQEHSGGPKALTPTETHEVPVDLFELFSFIQRKVEHFPRHNLRLRLRLPGMYSLDNGAFILTEVLTLSMNGMFLKAAARVKAGDRLTVVFSLLGYGKEMELPATVLYTVQPEARNNFFQGFAVAFENVPDDCRVQLQTYIRDSFLREVSSNRNGVGVFSADQLKS